MSENGVYMGKKHNEEPVVNDVSDDSSNFAETRQPKVISEESAETNDSKPGLKSKLNRYWTYYITHKKSMIPASIVALILLLLAVPASRYPLLGTFVKKEVSINVVDVKTNMPVSGVRVTVANISADTSQDGTVKLRVPVGKHNVSVTKKYYADAKGTVFAGLTGMAESEITLNPTGRQVKAKVVNKLSGKGVKNAQISAADTNAKTDDNGEATIVLPADNDVQDATITLDGYNKLSTKIFVIEADKVIAENTLSITPSGKVYFLSKRTGKINVMKSELDGSNAEVVLTASGSEDDGDTILLASQDWKYLALKSKRNGAGKPASLYLIDTANGDKLTTIDEGDATFTLTGWTGHTFVYQVQRDNVQFWQPNKYSIKSYNAESSKLTVLENTSGEGSGASSFQGTDYKSEYFGNVILLGGSVTYTKSWGSGIYYYGNTALSGKQNGIYSINADGSSKKQIKGFDATTNSNIEGKLYKPKEVYYRVYINDISEFYELENGTLSAKGDLTSTFNNFYPTYLASPSNSKTFWAEPRDGKNNLFIGNAEGSDEKTVTELGEYAAYGWYSDDYVLVSKNSSELYIISAGEIGDRAPIKVTDYHKPNTTFYGYGGGYGGL